MTNLDFAPLTAPVTKDELAAFRREPGATSRSATANIFVIVVFILVGAAMFFGVVASGLAIDSGGSSGFWLFIVVAIIVIAGFIAVRWFEGWVNQKRWLRLTRFARANGLEFAANSDVPGYPGAIFQTGNSRTVPERLYRRDGRFIDFGNYRYTTGSGKNKSTHHWGYLAIKLDRMLPQMVLDAKANNFLGTNLPMTFSRNQILHLEGKFDRYFTLYCPRQYERDALYVFTPDLMARLIDEAADFDVEIVDDWILFYTQQKFDLADPATLAGIFRIIDTVGEKTLDRTELYADSRMAGSDGATLAAAGAPLGSRLANNTVASQGRRLRKGLSVGTIIVVVAVGIYAVINFLPVFMNRF